MNVSLHHATGSQQFWGRFYQLVLLELFHFVEKLYLVALRGLGSGHCSADVVIFKEGEEAPAGGGMQETCEVSLD